MLLVYSDWRWYSATNAGSVNGSEFAQLNTTKVSYSVGSEISGITVSHSTEQTETNLLLSTWDGNDDHPVETYYLDSNGDPHKYNGTFASTDALVLYYDVFLDAQTNADVIAGLLGKTLTIKVSALTKDTSNREPDQNDYVTTASNAIIELVDVNGTPDGKVANSTAASGTGVTFTVPNSYAGAKTLIAKIAIRVDGGSTSTQNQDESTATICADFFVEVTSN